MSAYDVYKFLHIASAIVWIGSGFGLFVLTARMNGTGDRAGVLAVGKQAQTLGNRLFMPASVSTLLWGVLMVLASNSIGFTEVWILVGFAGIVISSIIGMALIEPAGERLGEIVAANGPDDPAVDAQIRRLLTINAVDLVVLFGVVWAMVMRPGA